jgi:excisionase family DNA binding protein
MDYRDPDWVAEKLGIDKNSVYRFLQDGTIPGLQLGRKWLVSERRLEEWLSAETDRQTRARREAVRSAERVVRRMDHYTADARAALKRAHAAARASAHEQLDQLHLLLGLAEDGASSAGKALKSLAVSPQAIRGEIEARLSPGTEPAPRRLGRNAEAKRAMRMASRMALREGADDPLSPVGTDHLLIGVLLARHGLGHDFLVQRQVTRKRLREALRAASSSEVKTRAPTGKRSS